MSSSYNELIIEELIGKCPTSQHLDKYLLENGLVITSLLWDYTKDGVKKFHEKVAVRQEGTSFMPSHQPWGSLTIAKTKNHGEFAGITTVDYRDKAATTAAKYIVDLDAAIVTSTGAYQCTGGSQHSVYIGPDQLPTWGGGHNLCLGTVSGGVKSAYSNAFACYGNTSVGKLGVSHIYTLRLHKRGSLGITTGHYFSSLPANKRVLCKEYFKGNLFVPVDELQFAAQEVTRQQQPSTASGRNGKDGGSRKSAKDAVSAIVERRSPVAFIGFTAHLDAHNSVFKDTKCIALGVSLQTRKEVEKAIEVFSTIFSPPELAEPTTSSSTTTTGGGDTNNNTKPPLWASRKKPPHTLIIGAPNDRLIKMIIKQNVEGIARLVVECCTDLNEVVEALEGVDLFEELVLTDDLNNGKVPTNMRKLAISFTKLKVKQVDPMESYEYPPPQWEKKYSPAKDENQVEGLPSLDLVPTVVTAEALESKDGTLMTFRTASGKIWPLTRRELELSGMMKKVLCSTFAADDDDDGEKSKEPSSMSAECIPQLQEGDDLPDAGLMDPTPSEKATALTRHLLTHFLPTSVEDQEEGWPLCFEAFFNQYIEPKEESEAELRRCCWLLAEMWGIACYLEIDVLLRFCRGAWVLMTSDFVPGERKSGGNQGNNKSGNKQSSAADEDDEEDEGFGGLF